MGDTIVILILLFVIVIALLRFRNHFRGGGCCGSGSKTIRSHKKLDAPAIGTTVLEIEGMHCQNCQARIENAINRLDGVVCHVNLHKKTATVSFSQPIAEEELKNIVEKLGYKVRSIL